MKIIKRCLYIFLALIMFVQFTGIGANASSYSFSELLYNNNIKIIGSNAHMNNYEFTNLINSAKKLTQNEKSKFTKKLFLKSDNILVTPEDILELHYYSLNSEEQSIFIKKISNQEVNISMTNEKVILISYNVNSCESRATTNYTSSREGTIKMQDSITGTWGSATVKLVGYFTKTTSGSTWTIKQAEDGYDTTENSYPPVGIVSNTVYSGNSFTSSSTYKGNEIKCYSYAQATCGFNQSSLYIYVYPNSSYNYAEIK